MMLYPAMNKLKSHIPNRYMLVNVVALRARQIADDAEEAGVQLDEKPVTLAIHEVADGKIDANGMDPVSYTHLDVYKRQGYAPSGRYRYE